MRKAYDIDLRLCSEHNRKYNKKRGCPDCQRQERLGDVKCPCCKSDKIEEGGAFQSNGVCGPGYRSKNLLPHLFCLDCGVIFKNLKQN